MIADERTGTAAVEGDALREAFDAGCDDADVTLATPLLRPEPLAGFATPIRASDDAFGGLPRV